VARQHSPLFDLMSRLTTPDLLACKEGCSPLGLGGGKPPKLVSPSCCPTSQNCTCNAAVASCLSCFAGCFYELGNICWGFCKLALVLPERR